MFSVTQILNVYSPFYADEEFQVNILGKNSPANNEWDI